MPEEEHRQRSDPDAPRPEIAANEENICWSFVNTFKKSLALRNNAPRQILVEMFWIRLRSRKQPWLLSTITADQFQVAIAAMREQLLLR